MTTLINKDYIDDNINHGIVMKLTFVRKIWITLFSIVCMLTSSVAYSLSASTMNMNMSLASATMQNVHCNMQTMDRSLMAKNNNVDHANTMADCINSPDDMKDCCSDFCAAINCMSTSSLITNNDTDLLSLHSTSLQSATSINLIKSSPSSSLYRPPIL